MFLPTQSPLYAVAGAPSPARGCLLAASHAQAPLSGFVRAGFIQPAGAVRVALPTTLGCARCQAARRGMGDAPTGRCRRPVEGLGFSWTDTLVGAGIGAGTGALESLLQGSVNSTPSSSSTPGFNPTYSPLPTATQQPVMVPAVNTTRLPAVTAPSAPSADWLPGVSNGILIAGGAVFASMLLMMHMGTRR